MSALRRLLRRLRHDGTRLASDRQGSLAMVLALALPVLIMGTGAVLSYVMAVRMKTRLDTAADSAVLSVVSQPGTQIGDDGAAGDAARNALLQAYFQKNAGADYASVKNATYSTSKANGTTKASMTWTAQTSTILPSFFADKLMTATGTSAATSAEPLYVDIYALVDASGSMGIGASAADQTKMQNGMGCTFACHLQGGDTTAHNLGATLRFDVIKNAVSTMVAAAKTRALIPNEFRFAIYKFSNRLTKVRPLTTDNSAVTTALNAMTLDGYVTAAGLEGAGTNFYKALTDLQSEIGTPGDGKTADKPLIFLLILTDGTGDDVFEQPIPYLSYWYPDPLFKPFAPVVYDNNQRITGFDPANCTPFKTKGISVMTLDIGYVIPPGTSDSRYIDIGNILKPKIMANMQACASRSSYAHQAETPSEIQTAITQMFEAAFSKARLTN
jgi:Flp pilus assembly protein TadG